MKSKQREKTMNHRNRHYSKNIATCFFLMFCLSLFAIFFLGGCDKKTGPSKGAPAKPAQAAAPQAPETKGAKTEEETYAYDRKGKRDPFVSLVVTAAEKPKKGQTPLESYDASAIKILGIVVTEKGSYASAVLPDGKAYTLREGMAVGLHRGKIEKIEKNYILIREMIKDYKGQLKSKETILKLREGEEE